MSPNDNMSTFTLRCDMCKGKNITVIDEDDEMDTITLKCKDCGNVEVLK